MITSKKQLIEALKQQKIKSFTTIENGCTGLFIGVERQAGDKIQTNAFTILTPTPQGAQNSWVYLNEIEITNNIIKYKNFPIQIKINEA